LKTRKDWRSASPPSLPLASCFSYCGSGRSSASSSGPTQPSDTHQPTHLVIGPLHPHVRSSLSSTQASDFSLLINFLKFTSERFKSYGILSTVQLLLDSSFLVVFKDKKASSFYHEFRFVLLSCHFLEVLMVKMNSFLFRIGDPPLLHLLH
jgi:hypothetical protein